MLLHRTGLPEETELVLCTVTNIQYNSVFVRLEEYGQQGMIHISEVSPGRIRNIRDFVSEGKVIICKVLRIDKERGHIDLSLRRVSEGQRRQKSSELKQEQRAEKIMELAANDLKQDPKVAYEKIARPVLKEYPYVFNAFDAVSQGELTLDQLGIPAEYHASLMKVIGDKIRPKTIEIGGKATLQTFESNGIELLKAVLGEAEQKFSSATIRYLGGSQYQLKITDNEYKNAEKKLKELQDFLETQTKAKKIKFEFARAA